MPALIVRDGPNAGERLEVEAEVVLGREAQEALQHDGEVSRRHAAIRPGAGGLEIEDLGSSNGTFVNDERIAGTTALAPGDVVRVGQTTLEVEATPATAGTVIRDVPEAVPPAEASDAAPEATAPIDVGPGPVPAGPPTGAPPLGPPPMGPPPAAQVGPPPAGPAYGPPPGMTGSRPGIVTAGGVVLIIVGLISLAFGIYRAIDLISLRGDVATFEQIFGPTDLESRLTIMIVFSVLGIIGSVLTTIGGIRLLARSRAGVVLGVIGTSLLILGWGGHLVYQLVADVILDPIEWAGLIASLLGAGAGLGLLLGGRRHVAPPMSTPWAA